MRDGVALVVPVDDGQPGWVPILTMCQRLEILVAPEPAATPGGRVTLVGGGPGPTDLLSVRAVAALRDADVVSYGRLGPQDLGLLAPGAHMVDVGKLPGHHKIAQADIEELLVAGALAGESEVRLKGGNPYVFGRGGEEVAACAKAGVPVSVVPGLSSAIALPAAAGIPVTHRGVSHMFTVVSGHAPLTDSELDHLAGLGGTIMLLMGIGTLPHLAAGLRRAGMRIDMPVAVVERGHRAGQRTTRSSLGSIERAAAACSNPAVVIIGAVVSVNSPDELEQFESLATMAVNS